MTSNAASGKSPATKTASKKKATAGSIKIVTASQSGSGSTRKKSGKSASGKSISGRSASARSPRKKAVKAAEPAGTPVYASDVVAAQNATGSGQKSASVLPAVLQPQVETLDLSPVPDDLPMERWPAQILQLAEEAFAKTGSWVVFYRAMLGIGGVVDQFYTNADARRYFETTAEFAELLEMVTAIRSQDDSNANAHEPTRVITVRMPRSMHEATIREAEELELCVNSYCLTKLLQPANPRFTPLELGNRRGRRPGPQITLKKVKVKKRR